MRQPKPRYAICDAKGSIVFETDIRLVAWWKRLAGAKQGAVVYDRKSWIIDPASWVRCGEPPSLSMNSD